MYLRKRRAFRRPELLTQGLANAVKREAPTRMTGMPGWGFARSGCGECVSGVVLLCECVRGGSVEELRAGVKRTTQTHPPPPPPTHTHTRRLPLAPPVRLPPPRHSLHSTHRSAGTPARRPPCPGNARPARVPASGHTPPPGPTQMKAPTPSDACAWTSGWLLCGWRLVRAWCASWLRFTTMSRKLV